VNFQGLALHIYERYDVTVQTLFTALPHIL